MTKKLPKPTEQISADMPKKLASILTPTSEPVETISFKDAMAPVSGKSKKIDLSKYSTVSSKDQNTFYVIGLTDFGIRMSIRVWKEASNTGTTALGYRIRVGDTLVDGAPVVTPDAALHALVPSSLVWTSAGTNLGHKSIVGQVDLPVPAWDSAAVITQLATLGFLETLHTSLVTTFSTFKLLSLVDLSDLIQSLTLVALSDVHRPKENKDYRFYLGYAKAPLFDVRNGVSALKVKPFEAPKPVGPKPVEPASPTSNAKPVPAQPYAAPHPKDAKKAATASK